MESERNEEARTAETKEEVKIEYSVINDEIVGTVRFSHQELNRTNNPFTLVNTRCETLRHKIAMLIK